MLVIYREVSDVQIICVSDDNSKCQILTDEVWAAYINILFLYSTEQSLCRNQINDFIHSATSNQSLLYLLYIDGHECSFNARGIIWLISVHETKIWALVSYGKLVTRIG